MIAAVWFVMGLVIGWLCAFFLWPTSIYARLRSMPGFDLCPAYGLARQQGAEMIAAIVAGGPCIAIRADSPFDHHIQSIRLAYLREDLGGVKVADSWMFNHALSELLGAGWTVNQIGDAVAATTFPAHARAAHNLRSTLTPLGDSTANT